MKDVHTMNTLETIKHALWQEIAREQLALDELKKKQETRAPRWSGEGGVLQKDIDYKTGYIAGLVKAANKFK